MRRVGWLLALLAFGLLAGAASAQNAAFNGLCSSGGRTATVQGLNSTNYLDGIVPKCTVTVYLTGTTTKAVIFKDAIGTILPNPFTANVLGSAAPGSWLFFAATSVGYDVVMSGGIAPNTFPLPVTLTDLQVGGGGGGGGFLVEVNGVPIVPASPANFVDTPSIIFSNTSGTIKAITAGNCASLPGDATSTNCGNGNFTAFTGTYGQAFGYQNINNISGTSVVAVGNNSVTGGPAHGGEIVGIGDFAAAGIAASNELVAIGDSPANNVSLIGAVCIGISPCTTTDGNVLTGTDMIGIGDSALDNSIGNTAMNNIIAIGQAAGSDLVSTGGTTTELILMGDGSGSNYTAPVNDIVAIGDGAGAISNGANYSPSTFAPSFMVAIGDGAGVEQGGMNIVGIGASDASRQATGTHDVVGIGNSSATGRQDGAGPLTIYAVNNIIGIGNGALARNKGNESIAIGDWSLGQTNCGSGFTGNAGDFNTAIGDHALAANNTGTHNVAIGFFSGSNGWTDCNPGDAGNSNTTGSQNTWIGDSTGPSSVTQLSNTIALGYQAAPTASNQTFIGNGSITQVIIKGIPDGCVSSSGGLLTGSGVACGSGGGGSAFSAITGSTNTTAAMILGTGSSLTTTGSGINAATSVGGIVVTGTPAIGNILTATSTSAANWQAPTAGVASVSNSDSTLTISPTTGPVVASLNAAHANTWSSIQTFSAGINLSGATSPLKVGGSAGTAGQCLTSAGATGTPTWGACGSGGGISGLTANFIPKAGSSSTLTANSALDDGVTTAATITSSEAVAINDATDPTTMGLTYNSGHAPGVGSATTALFAVDSGGHAEVSEAGAAQSRLCTAANGICAGGSSFTTVITPSGDTTGATDGAAIQTACTAGNNVQLTAGNYYVGASNTPITISVPCRVVGVGKATIIQNKGTTNDVFRITYFTTWVESPWAYPTSTDQSEFAWFQLSQASTPSAGYGFDIGSGIPVSGGTFSYTMNVHIHDTVMNGLWGGVRTQTDELYAFVNDNMWRNFVGGSCIYHDAEVGSGDNHYTDDECSGLTHSGITITQGEANYFKGVKLNGSGITFTGAGATKSMIFNEMSIETGISQPCMLDFGTGSAIVNTQFNNSEQLGFVQTFCNSSNATGMAFSFNNSTATTDYAAGLITNNGYATVAFPSVYQDFATFAGTAATPLSSYTTSAGKTFVQYTADGSSPQIMPQLSGSSSELVPGAVNSFGDVLDTLTPSSANYSVSETFTLTNTTDQVGVFGRANSGANTQYVFLYGGSGTVSLYAIVSGSATLLGAPLFTWTAGATHTMSMGMSGTSISASVDGVPITGSPFTDSHIAAAGQAGSRIYAGATGTNFSVQ